MTMLMDDDEYLSVIDDIKLEFPDAKGYSVRNLKYMAKLARTYPEFGIVQRTVAQIPWRHNIALIDKLLPEYAGKLNFYISDISAVDDLLKSDTDNPTIGILLCKNKKGMIAEYELRDIEKPIGVSEYRLFEILPEKYAGVLPSAEDIEKRIGLDIDEYREQDIDK
jgi:hypothetical protein